MKRFFPLIFLCTAPFFAQELPPLAPAPLAPVMPQAAAETNLAPAVVPAVPLIPAQIAPQPVQEPVKAAPQPLNIPSVPNKELERAAQGMRPFPSQKSAPQKEMSTKEYRAAKRRLFEQMRASESVFRKSGAWYDLAVSSYDFSASYNPYSGYRGFSHYGIYNSFGKVTKGFMFGLSLQYNFSQSYYKNGLGYGLPSTYEIAGVLGYRIAPGRILGMRLMMHIGYGSGIHNRMAYGPTVSTPLRYVLLMPELRLDVKIYKSFIISLGFAYKGMVFVGASKAQAGGLQSELGLNGLRNFRTSIGLSYNY